MSDLLPDSLAEDEIRILKVKAALYGVNYLKTYRWNGNVNGTPYTTNTKFSLFDFHLGCMHHFTPEEPIIE